MLEDFHWISGLTVHSDGWTMKKIDAEKNTLRLPCREINIGAYRQNNALAFTVRQELDFANGDLPFRDVS